MQADCCKLDVGYESSFDRFWPGSVLIRGCLLSESGQIVQVQQSGNLDPIRTFGRAFDILSLFSGE